MKRLILISIIATGYGVYGGYAVGHEVGEELGYSEAAHDSLQAMEILFRLGAIVGCEKPEIKPLIPRVESKKET